jgi:chromosome segregation ATPase
MTNEEMQKAMEFIVNQQAQASAKIDALAEAQKEAQDSQKQAQKDAEERWRRSDERWTRSDERWTRTEEGIRALLSIAEIHEREINATDERLNALINVVERQIGEGRNGKP